MNPKTWEASGHLATFSDPLIDCKDCNTRHRADKLVEDDGVEDAGGMTKDEAPKDNVIEVEAEVVGTPNERYKDIEE